MKTWPAWAEGKNFATRSGIRFLKAASNKFNSNRTVEMKSLMSNVWGWCYTCCSLQKVIFLLSDKIKLGIFGCFLKGCKAGLKGEFSPKNDVSVAFCFALGFYFFLHFSPVFFFQKWAILVKILTKFSSLLRSATFYIFIAFLEKILNPVMLSSGDTLNFYGDFVVLIGIYEIYYFYFRLKNTD